MSASSFSASSLMRETVPCSARRRADRLAQVRVLPLQVRQQHRLLTAVLVGLGAEVGEPCPGATAVERLLEGFDQAAREHLARFAVRVGARRFADAARWLGRLGMGWAAEAAQRQARPAGSLRYPVATGDVVTVARTQRELAPTYGKLLAALKFS